MRRSQPPRACCATRALLAPVCPRMDARAVCMREKPGGLKVLTAGASREFDNRGRGGKEKGERGGSEGSAECPWRALQHQHQHHRRRQYFFLAATSRSLCLRPEEGGREGGDVMAFNLPQNPRASPVRGKLNTKAARLAERGRRRSLVKRRTRFNGELHGSRHREGRQTEGWLGD